MASFFDQWTDAHDPLDFRGTKQGAALDSQRDAADQANETLRYMYDTTRGDFAPYREAGGAALSDLAGGKFMDNYLGDPGFQFRMNEGMKALQGSASAKGMLNSGASLKELTRFGQDYASNEYQNAYNREFGRLSQLAGYGQASAAQTAATGQAASGGVAENVIGVGNAQAAATMGSTDGNKKMIGTTLGAIFSDERLKKNVRAVSKEDMDELRSVIKPRHFEYISKDYGHGEWIGVMAQDLERSKLGRTVVFEDKDGNKKVHMLKLLSLLVASFGEAA